MRIELTQGKLILAGDDGRILPDTLLGWYWMMADKAEAARISDWMFAQLQLI